MNYIIRKSIYRNKKYDAVFPNGIIVPFGDSRYQQYYDSALGLYSKMDHLDDNRRRLFKLRHAKNIKNKYSAAWFSDKYLW